MCRGQENKKQTFSKQWIHFFLSFLCPPTSNMWNLVPLIVKCSSMIPVVLFLTSKMSSWDGRYDFSAILSTLSKKCEHESGMASLALIANVSCTPSSFHKVVICPATSGVIALSLLNDSMYCDDCSPSGVRSYVYAFVFIFHVGDCTLFATNRKVLMFSRVVFLHFSRSRQ